MFNHHRFTYKMTALVFAAALVAFSTSGRAQFATPQDTASPPPPTVTGIHVDKTAKNAVVAREQAIIEAQRTAFEILAEKSMSPDAFKTYQVPDDATIETLVRDFQISNEQMSSNRYVADFTVRFTQQLANYITLPPGLGVVYASPDAAKAAMTAATSTSPAAAPQASSVTSVSQGGSTAVAANAPQDTTSVLTGVVPAQTAPLANRNILVLPYFQQADGQRILWDDPNPWRDAWQEKGTSSPLPHLTVTVPLGDLTDVSSGDPGAVWRGDYRTIEELRANYDATSVAVLLAHAPNASEGGASEGGASGGGASAGAAPGIDFYLYKDGVFTRMQSIPGTYDTPASFKKAVTQAIVALEAPQPYGAASASGMPLTPLATPVAVVNEPAPAATQMSVSARMNFGNFSEWMQAQKRLASVVPPVSVGISSITTHAVQFTISFTGTLASLETALAAQGLEIDQPVDNVGVSVPGNAAPTQQTVYQLKLAAAATSATAATPAVSGSVAAPVAAGPAATNSAAAPAAGVSGNINAQ